ncbi:hypothetical protein [Vibrio marisflavi]|uniref:Uncharacterized protein n=1 Tax=Vibrio marisflavi CECT 7928 TaxID=634439 RepID=A0ABN8EBI5_9VIBR|nr:hypothetical protein [Vibrio marisflavi]CAH0542941.1 hypothetical protein VMF7928_04319 [Vibrio marisflavi CECT 7928]
MGDLTLPTGSNRNKIEHIAQHVNSMISGAITLPFVIKDSSGVMQVPEQILISQGIEHIAIADGSISGAKTISLARLSNLYPSAVIFGDDPVLNFYVDADMYVTGNPADAMGDNVYWTSDMFGGVKALPRLNFGDGGSRLKLSGFSNYQMKSLDMPDNEHPMLNEESKIQPSNGASFSINSAKGIVMLYGEVTASALSIDFTAQM